MSKLKNQVAFSSRGENVAEENKVANKSELKKKQAQAAEATQQPAATEGAQEGEKKGPSKKDLKKLEKKAKKTEGKKVQQPEDAQKVPVADQGT